MSASIAQKNHPFLKVLARPLFEVIFYAFWHMIKCGKLLLKKLIKMSQIIINSNREKKALKT